MKRQINKRDTLSPAVSYGGSAILMGLPFLLIGAYFALAGFGFLPLPGKANAPLWVIGYVGIAFGLAGLVLIVNGTRGVVRKRRRRALAAAYPRDRWVLDYDWNPQGIKDRAHTRALGALIGAALFAAFLAPFNWWAFISPERPLMVQIITGLFDLAWLVGTGFSVYYLLQFLKYGRSHLRFRRFPFFLGGKLEVVFSPSRFDDLRATLRFVEERFERRGSGRNASVQQVNYEHYSAEQRPAVSASMREVPISFDLPDNPEWDTEISATPVRYWELVVEAEVPGIDFRTTFPVPVYARNSRGLPLPR